MIFRLCFRELEIAGHERGDLSACGGALRVQIGRAVLQRAVDDAVGYAPAQGVRGIGADAAGIREELEIGARGDVHTDLPGIAVQDGGQLLAGDLGIRVKLVVANTVDDAVLRSPCDGLRVPLIGGNVREAVRALVRRTGAAPQHRDEHGAGHGGVRLERHGPGAVHQAAVDDVVHTVGIPLRAVEVEDEAFAFTVKRRASKRKASARARRAVDLLREEAELDQRPRVGDDAELFERLRALRKEISTELEMAPYMVFSDKALRGLCRLRPQTRDELIQVNGIGEKKADAFGEQFMAAIEEFESEHARNGA